MGLESRLKLFAALGMFLVIAGVAWIVSIRSERVPETPTAVATEDHDTVPGPVGDEARAAPIDQPPSSSHAAVPPAERSGLCIAGRVVDGENRPVEGARIAAYHIDRGATYAQSNPDGTFEIWGLEDLEYRVSATKQHHNEAVHESVSAGYRNTVLVLTGLSSVSGTVVDARSSAPVTAFDVVVLDAPPGSARHWQHIVRDDRNPWRFVEHPDGTFTIDDVPSDRTTAVGVRAFGYAPAYAAMEPISPGMNAGPIVIALEEEARIEGRILASDGRGVHGAQVFAGTKPDGVVLARSDDTGFYSATWLEDGPIQLTAAHENYVSATVDLFLTEGETKTADIRLGEGGVIAGTVYLGETPVPMVSVSASKLTPPRMQSKAVTDADGQYAIRGVPPGVVDLIANLSQETSDTIGPMNLQQSAVVVQGSTTTVDFQFPENLSQIFGTISVEDTVPLRFTVMGAIITGAGDRRFSAVYDPEGGGYAVTGLPPGSGWLSVSATGQDGVARERRVEFELGENENLAIDVDFEGGAAIFGSVQGLSADQGGEVIALPGEVSIDKLDAQQYLELSRRQAASSPIDANGAYRFEGIQPGTYTIAVFVLDTNDDTNAEALANVRSDWRTVTVTGDDDGVELSFSLHTW